MTVTNITAEPGKQEFVIRGVFDAPRDRVFKAYTDPDLIPEWWGPEGLATTVDKKDFRPGGIWRFVQRSQDGNEYGFHGVYHEIAPPERLIFTSEFEGMPGHVTLETVTLEEQDGKTRVTDTVVFQSTEDRDGALQSGMEAGATESMERFAKVLAQR